MKIAVSSTSKVPSETANSIQMMLACQGLVQNGHEVRLWVPDLERVSFNVLRKHYGLTVDKFRIHSLLSLPFLNRLDFSLSMILRAFFWNPAVVYTWTIPVAAMGGFLGATIVLEIHDVPCGKLGTSMFNYFIGSDADKRVVFISEALKQRVQEQFPKLKDAECVVAPNGVEPADYENLPDTAAAKQEMGFHDGMIVSCSGHLYAGRGVELFMELARRFPQVHFYWFGGNPDEAAAYRQQVADKGQDNVFFTGFIPRSELPLAQKASDILLMPYGKAIAGSSGGDSAAICSPMKMFEYLAAGKPILTSDIPVIHEVLNSENAIFCEPENVDSWAAALARVLEDPALRESLSNAALQESKKYSWKERAARILSFAKR